MSILFADGFELGTTFAEANTMSGAGYVQSAYVNATSTFTYGASSSGQGRSLTMTIFPNSTTGTNNPRITTAVNGFLGASSTNGYVFSLSFKAKLNPNKVAVNSGFGLGVIGSNTSLVYLGTTTTQTAGATINIWFGTATVGSFSVADLNMHTYTMTAIKTAANVWTLSVYLDKTRVYFSTGLSASLVDAITLFLADSVGTTLTSQVNMFSEIDDLYISDTTPLGMINIRRISPTSDIQAQWTKVGSQPTNYQSVDNVSLTTGNSVTSTVAAQDIYGTGSTLTGGYKLLAVQATAMCVGAATDTVTANASAGANSIASSAVALSGLDTRVSTGWQNLVVAGSLNTLSFGQTKA